MVPLACTLDEFTRDQLTCALLCTVGVKRTGLGPNGVVV